MKRKRLKITRLSLLLLLLIILFWWTFLLPVSISDNKNSTTVISQDEKWKIVLTPVVMTTPLTLIPMLENRKYIVLFDQDGHYSFLFYGFRAI